MNSRDRLRSGDLQSDIERRLEEILNSHQGLRDLRERRRRAEIANKLSEAKPLQEVLDDIFKKSPSLTALFVKGTDLSNPFRSKLVGEKPEFYGEQHPSYFNLKPGDEYKDCHINLRFRVQFETDVVNDYFRRDRYPGKFIIYVNGEPTQDYVINLWQGTATVTVRLPENVNKGDDLTYKACVVDDVIIDPICNEFTRHVIGPRKSTTSTSGKRRPPAGNGRGDRLVPEGLAMPQVKEVRENEWTNHGFDKYSALKVIYTGEDGYDFFVNMDNVYLLSEIKGAPREDPELYEAKFKYGLVLIGLALLNQGGENDPDAENVEQQILELTRSVAPVLLPMINTLGDLELSDTVNEGELS